MAYEAQTVWFHVFKDMIDSGDMAKLDGSAIKVYLVIKSYTNFNTGRAFPGHELIAEKAGLSEAQVKRCLTALGELGYISKGKEGRKSVYTLREKVRVMDANGEATAVATWDYLPSSISHAVADLKNVLLTGDLAGAKIVHIERLNVQVINGNGGNVIQFNESDFAKLPPDMREQLLDIQSKTLS
ncbi:MAG TPA: helix-turn-helix domain-containing protein [Pseudolabrys sp.]|jgi:hypothetical protein|nr:helix-turn-helix domain-containing protein [Pseudolabrys sp.]